MAKVRLDTLRKRPNHNRPIVKIDQAGKIVGRYKNTEVAASENGINSASVWACCNGGRNQINGYRYRYEDVIMKLRQQ